MGERTTIRQPRDAKGERRSVPERRSPGALALSVALHVALVALLAPVLVVPAGSLVRLFARGEPPVAESLAYVDVAPGTGAPAAEPGGAPPPPRAEPDERAAETPPVTTREEPLVAPRETPSTVPPVGGTPGGVLEGTAGGVTGGTGGSGGAGAAAGLRPTFTDSPIWTRPEVVARRPLDFAEKIDSALAGDFEALRDSAVVAANRRRPGDWTFERNGQTYGMDQQFIRLGRISIPTAVLGVLNLGSTQANPTAVDRERRLSQMRREIQEQAHRIQTEEDIRDVIAEIRARKDRERAARRAAQGRSGG